MHRLKAQLLLGTGLSVLMALLSGCGTTRSSDTNRTATEQLLISDAIDRAVQSVDLRTLADQSVFLDDSRLGDVVDRNYLISTIRQHLLANGCHLRDQRDQADFIVEARAGAVGTDRNDLLFGIPSTNVPQIFPIQPLPAAAIPEIPIAKRRDQRGIAKIGVFAYHRETGTPVWQSGLVHQESSSNDVWILGAGPFQRGSIYDGTTFAGKSLSKDDDEEESAPRRLPAVDLATASVFTPPKRLTQTTTPSETESTPAEAPSVVQASLEDAPPPAAVPKPPEAAPADPVAEADQTQKAAPQSVATKPAVATPPAAASVYVPSDGALPQPRFDSR